MTSWLHHLTGLFYPRLCLACTRKQPPRHSLLCPSCRLQLPRTDHWQHQENAFTERFWGRVPLYSGAAMFHFMKGGHVQHLLHQLKYGSKPEIGVQLGEWFGRDLRQSPFFQSIEAIVPVPLHPKKEHARGYNQSDVFAKGLSISMGVPWYKHGLKRRQFTESQTRKSRLERFGNVEEVFVVGEAAALRGRHILLVDDVVTTGATLEACAQTLLKVLPGVRISMVTIAIAG